MCESTGENRVCVSVWQKEGAASFNTAVQDIRLTCPRAAGFAVAIHRATAVERRARRERAVHDMRYVQDAAQDEEQEQRFRPAHTVGKCSELM